jgi:hypothetical protein
MDTLVIHESDIQGRLYENGRAKRLADKGFLMLDSDHRAFSIGQSNTDPMSSEGVSF